MLENEGFVRCWNEILTPKWIRFRHLLSGNGAEHSDVAFARGLFVANPGEKVLDIGCGFGETCLDFASRVGPAGEVHGLDCTRSFLDIADQERRDADIDNVRYELADAQVHDLPANHYDVAYSRFGVMFFDSAVAAMRNANGALKKGGRLYLIVWRSLVNNPAWVTAKEVALKYLPPPGDGASTCGPGPFSMAHEETTRLMLKAAGFSQVDHFEQIDVDMCIGRDLEEAIDYQILVGPSGEIIREAGAEGQQRLPEIRRDLKQIFSKYLVEGGVCMPSSSWAIAATKS
jgi:SAM-dependent methyltransferase